MPSFLPTDITPTDVDDFGIGVDVGIRPDGVDRTYLKAKPGLTTEPASGLPQGTGPKVERRKREGVSDLPTDVRVEETTLYPFGNPRSGLNTIVDTDSQWIYPNEATPKKNQVSGKIRGLASALKGEQNA